MSYCKKYQFFQSFFHFLVSTHLAVTLPVDPLWLLKFGPFWTQTDAKFMVKLVHKNCVHFWRIFGRFGIPYGVIWGSFWAPKTGLCPTLNATKPLIGSPGLHLVSMGAQLGSPGPESWTLGRPFWTLGRPFWGLSRSILCHLWTVFNLLYGFGSRPGVGGMRWSL